MVDARLLVTFKSGNQIIRFSVVLSSSKEFHKIETQTCRARPFVRSSYFQYSSTTFQNSNQYSFPIQTIPSPFSTINQWPGLLIKSKIVLYILSRRAFCVALQFR